MDTTLAAVLMEFGIAPQEVKTQRSAGLRTVYIRRGHAVLTFAIAKSNEAKALLGGTVLWDMSWLDDDLDERRTSGAVVTVADLRPVLRRFVSNAA